MTTGIYPRKTTNLGKILTLGVLTIALLAGVAFGVNYLWQKRFGPTTASAADCRLAQQLFDQAQTPPSDKVAAQKWEQEIRQIRYTKFVDTGISTQVGIYVHWAAAKATGEGQRPTDKEFKKMKDEAIGHCDDSGVDLKIPAIAF